MTDNFLSSHSQILDKQSFYNGIRKVGGASTPFFDALDEGGAFNGSPMKGHKWGYRPQPTAGEANAYAEGSRRADVTHWSEVELCNHLQIFKKTAGITRSESKAMSEEGKIRKLEDDQLANRLQMGLDIELALLSANPPVVALVKTDIRKMGGIKSYVPATGVIDAATSPLSKKNHLDAATKIMHKHGVRGAIQVQCGEDVFEDLQYILADKKLLKNNETVADDRVTHITNAWFTNVKLVSNPNLAADEMLVFAPSLIKIVLLDSVKGRECSDPAYDDTAEEDIMELTLRVEDPHACIWVKNIGRS